MRGGGGGDEFWACFDPLSLRTPAITFVSEIGFKGGTGDARLQRTHCEHCALPSVFCYDYYCCCYYYYRSVPPTAQPTISGNGLFIVGQTKTMACYISTTETTSNFPLTWSRGGVHAHGQWRADADSGRQRQLQHLLQADSRRLRQPGGVHVHIYSSVGHHVRHVDCLRLQWVWPSSEDDIVSVDYISSNNNNRTNHNNNNEIFIKCGPLTYDIELGALYTYT